VSYGIRGGSRVLSCIPSTPYFEACCRAFCLQELRVCAVSSAILQLPMIHPCTRAGSLLDMCTRLTQLCTCCELSGTS
jgi:hypothetical protein